MLAADAAAAAIAEKAATAKIVAAAVAKSPHRLREEMEEHTGDCREAGENQRELSQPKTWCS
jgi:hypothetical protein